MLFLWEKEQVFIYYIKEEIVEVAHKRVCVCMCANGVAWVDMLCYLCFKSIIETMDGMIRTTE